MNFGSLTAHDLFEEFEKDEGRRASFDIPRWSFKVSSTVSFCYDNVPDVSDVGQTSACKAYRSWYDKTHAVTELPPASMTSDGPGSVVGMADVRRAIEMVYEWELRKQGRMASAYVVYFVESHFSQNNLSAVNNMLLNAAPERLTEWSLIALLRASFSARDQLPAWYGFMGAVRKRLKGNERLERLLIGLN